MPNPSSGGIAVASTLGHPGELRPVQYGPDRRRPQRRQADRRSRAPDLRGRTAGLRRPGQVRRRLRFRSAARQFAGHAAEQEYLKQRAGADRPGNRVMGTAQPGDFGPVPLSSQPPGPEHGTSHISVVDKYGNAAAMTTTVESAFGSFHVVDGFVLNNQLTDFSAQPTGPRRGAARQPRRTRQAPAKFDGADAGVRRDTTARAATSPTSPGRPAGR